VSDQPKETVLVVDDEVNIRKVLSTLLERAGYAVVTAPDGSEALDTLASEQVSVVVTDVKMRRVDGMELLRRVRKDWPDVPVILITAFGTVDLAVEALKAGAFDFVTKPFDRTEIRQVIDKAARQFRLNQEAVHAGEERAAGDRFGMVGDSAPMRELFQLIARVADTPTTVLLTGESGTGKELVARALHEHSSRKKAPFIRINCAAIPRELVESELFGHERGAFTGAVQSKPGRFELADGGTLFLDEVGEIPVESQVKLLRAIQEGTFERVGGVRTLKSDVRLVAATNRDLQGLIAEGRFREDLFYRLNVVPLFLPPLRERGEDVPRLLRHACGRAARRLTRPAPVFDDDATEVLCRYTWPGNIRELENVVERTVLLSDSLVLETDDLPTELRKAVSVAEAADHAAAPVGGPNLIESAGLSLKEAVRQGRVRIERELIARALQETGGNVTHASQRLGISRKSLQLKMKELGLRAGEGESSAG
jgi:two-component system, NtrC family, response regulator AtoC